MNYLIKKTFATIDRKIYFRDLDNIIFDYYLIGLGNPEEKYKNNRHNIGKIYISYLANNNNLNFKSNKFCEYFVFNCKNPNRNKKLPPIKILALNPKTYMNTSGLFVSPIIKSFDCKVDQLKIVCDDLETEIGKVKFSLTGGDRGHNGLKSIVQQIKSNDFEKIKIGIGRPNSKDPDVVANYCLSNFPSDHFNKIKIETFEKIDKHINLLK